MNKKGVVLESFWIFSLIICVLFLLTMLAWIDSQADSGGVIKSYLTRDISLALDTLQLSSGNVTLNYVTGLPAYLEIKDGVVLVKDVESESFDRYYFSTNDIKINFPKKIVTNELIISEDGNNLIIEEKK